MMRYAGGSARAFPATSQADDAEFADAVLEGLSRPHKSLPCRYFYDERGSQLFEEITHLPEYYPTRTEITILSAHAPEMVGGNGEGCVLVEFGSGSSRKTEILLEAMPGLIAYIPIDVSADALREARARLQVRFPGLDVRPIHGDFSTRLDLRAEFSRHRKLGFFPGSTIGNVERTEGMVLLSAFRRLLSPAGRLIIGVDLVKDVRILLDAYNDRAGVTAAFNLNLLARINRTFGHAFDLAAFRHEAIYNARHSRIEMHLVSTHEQTIRVLDRSYRFEAGEKIHTENSHKYTVSGFREFARAAGWRPRRIWTDDDDLFSVHELTTV